MAIKGYWCLGKGGGKRVNDIKAGIHLAPQEVDNGWLLQFVLKDASGQYCGGSTNTNLVCLLGVSLIRV